MDIRQLRQLQAVGRAGSFSKAAKALDIAQPTLSYSIARLEDELGVKLFDRSGWRAQVTPIGEFLLDQASSLIDDADRVDRSIRLFARGEVGDIRLGVAPALRTVYMAKLSERLITSYPKLKITVIADNVTGLKSGVASGDYDVIFLTEAAVTGMRKLIVQRVLEERAVAVAAPGHPLAGVPKVSVAKFADHEVIGYADSSTSDPILFTMPQLMREERDGDGFAPRVVTNDVATTLELAKAGLGLYAGPAHIVRTSLERGELVQLDVDWVYTYRAAAVMTAAASLSPLLMEVVAHAKEVGAELTSQDLPHPRGKPDKGS